MQETENQESVRICEPIEIDTKELLERCESHSLRLKEKILALKEKFENIKNSFKMQADERDI